MTSGCNFAPAGVVHLPSCHTAVYRKNQPACWKVFFLCFYFFFMQTLHFSMMDWLFIGWLIFSNISSIFSQSLMSNSICNICTVSNQRLKTLRSSWLPSWLSSLLPCRCCCFMTRVMKSTMSTPCPWIRLRTGAPRGRKSQSICTSGRTAAGRTARSSVEEVGQSDEHTHTDQALSTSKRDLSCITAEFPAKPGAPDFISWIMPEETQKLTYPHPANPSPLSTPSFPPMTSTQLASTFLRYTVHVDMQKKSIFLCLFEHRWHAKYQVYKCCFLSQHIR